METERSGDPRRESKPSAHRHGTARDMTDQGRDLISVARANVGGHGYSLSPSRISVPSDGRASVVFWFILVGNFIVFLQDTFAECLRPLIKITVSRISSSRQSPQNAVHLLKYQEFAISCYGHQFEMFESVYTNQGLVNCMFKSISIIAIRLMKY